MSTDRHDPTATGDATRPDEEPAQAPAREKPTRCLRCGRNEPVDEDGFCEPCLKEIDQACL